MTDDPRRLAAQLAALAAAFGALWYFFFLVANDMADFDIWARLAVGASLWHRGARWEADPFSFLPVLPKWIDHEWGVGIVYYPLLRFLGPIGLLAWKVFAAFGALLLPFAAARLAGANLKLLLLLAIPCAMVIRLPYAPVARPHTFTYLFFALTIFLLMEVRRGRLWLSAFLPPIFLVWANVHGGYLSGLGACGFFALGAWPNRRSFLIQSVVAALSFAVTFINPWGVEFFIHLLKSVVQKRPNIGEWGPLNFLQSDTFNATRFLIPFVAVLVAAGWRRVDRHNWPGLALLAVTAIITLRARRHSAFFAISALAFAAPYAEAVARALWIRLPEPRRAAPAAAVVVFAVHGLLAAVGANHYLPQASFTVLAQRGLYPVREADILAGSGISGNLACPFGWGSYLSWRLYPNIKVSCDGRYETAYPESTKQLNDNFHLKQSDDWTRLLTDHRVDFVILSLDGKTGHVQPSEIEHLGYRLVWLDEGSSALLVKEDRLEELRQRLPQVPETTIQPLDATIPDKWPWPAAP